MFKQFKVAYSPDLHLFAFSLYYIHIYFNLIRVLSVFKLPLQKVHIYYFKVFLIDNLDYCFHLYYFFSSALSSEVNQAIYGKCNNPNGHGHNYIGKVMPNIVYFKYFQFLYTLKKFYIWINISFYFWSNIIKHERMVRESKNLDFLLSRVIIKKNMPTLNLLTNPENAIVKMSTLNHSTSQAHLQKGNLAFRLL